MASFASGVSGIFRLGSLGVFFEQFGHVTLRSLLVVFHVCPQWTHVIVCFGLSLLRMIHSSVGSGFYVCGSSKKRGV